MIQLINKLKKNQKGFTLVELIVVLVILAILAAFTIPAMLGFVNDARGKAYVAEAREVYMAYQTATSDIVTKSSEPEKNDAYKANYVVDKTTTTPSIPADLSKAKPIQLVQNNAMNNLAGDITKEGKQGDDSYTAPTLKDDTVSYGVVVDGGKVIQVQYSKGGYLVTLDTKATDGGATVTKGGKVSITGSSVS